MNVPAKYTSVNALYPIQRDDSMAAIVQAVLSWEKTREGGPKLHRELSVAEKTLLQDRYKLLSQHLNPAKSGEIIDHISRMMMGFGGNNGLDLKTAKTIAAQFAHVLKMFPLWVIERTCGKFASGQVRPDEVEGVNRAYGPSTAQFHVIAQGIVAGYFAERHQIYDCLHGVVQREISEEERERVRGKLNELAESMKGQHLDAAKPAGRPITDEWIAETAAALQRRYGSKSEGTSA